MAQKAAKEKKNTQQRIWAKNHTSRAVALTSPAAASEARVMRSTATLGTRKKVSPER